MCPDGSAPRDRQADRELRNILGLDETGETPPLESYDIGCDEGSWNAFLRKLWCGAQAMPFAFGKWSIGVGTDLMDWALEFRIARSLTPLAGLLSDVYDTSLVGPLGLRHFAWTCAMFAAGWHLLRARAARGAGEIAATCLVAALGTIVLANPQGYLDGSITLAQNTSGAVLEATDEALQGASPGEGTTAVRDRLGSVLRRSFVAEPYDLLNWGVPLTGDCATARDQILAGGPWGSEDTPRDIMRDHGCDAQAEFNARPTDSRAAASLIVAATAVVATALLTTIALVVFVAQLTLVAAFGGASIVWALALFPGGRDLLSWWIGRLVWAVVATIGSTFVLSWLAITVTATLAATSDVSVVQRCLVALLLVGFGFRLRAHVGRGVEALSRRFGNRLADATTSRSAPAAAGFAAGAAGGAGLSAMARSWAYDMPGGRYAYSRLYARHFTRGARGRGGPLRSTRRALDQVQHAAGTGGGMSRSIGRGVRAVALAPITGPAAYAATRSRATAASQRVRARLQQAQATRRQWTTNAAHPVRALRDAGRAPEPPAPRRPGPRIARPAQPRPGGSTEAQLRESLRAYQRPSGRLSWLTRRRSAFFVAGGGAAAAAAAGWLIRRRRSAGPAGNDPQGSGTGPTSDGPEET